MVPSMTKRRRRQRLILLARRLHLYFGLFLLPWVLLYGLTAIFFNHPAAFHSRSLTHYGADVLDGSLLADPPAAAVLAGAVLSFCASAGPLPARFALLASAAASLAFFANRSAAFCCAFCASSRAR